MPIQQGKLPFHEAVFTSVRLVNNLLAGCGDPLHRDNHGRTPLRLLYLTEGGYYGYSAIFTTLVAAGDRSWQRLPTLCPGLEAAILSVWLNAPDEMPELLKRLKNPPRNVIELFACLHG